MAVVETSMKICVKCGEDSPIDQFPFVAGKNKRYGQCRPCRNAYAVEWRKKNPAAHKAAYQKAYQKRKHLVDEARLLRHFGMTSSEYDEMLQRQNHVCAVCYSSSDRKLAVDHDHSTGRIRGLLCMSCNIILGHVKDDPIHLRSLAEYLEESWRS